MILSCTKKVLDKIKKYKPVENDKEEIGFNNWYVDLINLERKNYFLFTHSKTLFSFFIYAGTQKELKNIEALFEDKLEEQIIREIGTNPKYLELLLPPKTNYRFLKTNSRSVLGSMNDLKYHIKMLAQDKGELKYSSDIITHYLNQIPMGTLKYKRPVEVIKEELKSFLK